MGSGWWALSVRVGGPEKGGERGEQVSDRGLHDKEVDKEVDKEARMWRALGGAARL